MGLESVAPAWWAALGVGVAVSLLLEQLLLPAVPRWRRPGGAWLLHLGLWLPYQSAFSLVLGRPWLGLALSLVGLMTLVVVSNAKFRSLREPFTVHDFEYFTDAMRHPRLYLPFLRASPSVVIACLGVLAALWACFVLEPNLYRLYGASDVLLAAVLPLLLSGWLLFLARISNLPLSYSADDDLARLGLLPYLWRYAEELRRPLELRSPFNEIPPISDQIATMPHLVVVQSESFFDPRGLFAGIKPEVLREFDAIRQESLCHGRLDVPAWGANTIRTEFSFLFGLSPEAQGVHRFQPYRTLARSGLPQLVGLLRQAGYRTVCIHPYPASFYGRDRLFPELGFDEFLDIGAFEPKDRAGPYIGDAAVTNKITALLKAAHDQPLFIFAITMENHGPLHLERPSAEDHGRLYHQAPPPDCRDLTVYLRHLRNADVMIGRLRETLLASPRPGYLCWYGDHVPIMSKVYARLGEPGSSTDYFLWRSPGTSEAPVYQDMAAHELAPLLLGMLVKN
jgi:phosphoglycerol transferase MdoB-like AlkP superfamily enzyme